MNLFVSLIPKYTSICISKAFQSIHENQYVETQDAMIAIFHDENSVSDIKKHLNVF